MLDDKETTTRPQLRRRKTNPTVSDALLSVPSHQEVVRVLVAQKDIFPVLKGILKLATEDPTLFSGLERRNAPFDMTNSPPREQPAGPSKKKRKLDHVPAGADDWDVPFPFAEGYGPQSYRRDWKRERAKQLASQLMSLIKDAIRIAAIKSYWKQRMFESQLAAPLQVGSSYGATSSGSSREPTPFVFSSSPTPSTPTTQNQDQGLDQLVSSLLSAVPGQNALPHQGALSQLAPEGNPAPFADIFQDLDTAQSDQSMLDTWMSILNTFPASQDGFPLPDTPALGVEPFLGDDLTMPVDDTLSSTPAPTLQQDFSHYDYNISPSNFQHTPTSFAQHQHSSSHPAIDFNSMQIDSFPPSETEATLAATSTSLPSLASTSTSSGLLSTSSTLMDIDENIDPALYQLSGDAGEAGEGKNTGKTSGSSLKLSLPSDFGGPQGEDHLQPALSPGLSSASSALYTPISATQELGPPPEIFTHSTLPLEDPYSRAPSYNPWELPSYTNGDGMEPQQKQQLAGSSTASRYTSLPVPKPRKGAKQTTSRNDGLDTASVLERARARRMQLRVQLEEAKVKLWEVMMEGNALNYLHQHS